LSADQYPAVLACHSAAHKMKQPDATSFVLSLFSIAIIAGFHDSAQFCGELRCIRRFFFQLQSPRLVGGGASHGVGLRLMRAVQQVVRLLQQSGHVACFL